MAVAGFAEKDLTVEVKDNCLRIESCGLKPYSSTELSEKNPRHLIHRGISERSFIKKFQLHKYVVVDGAEFKDGMLTLPDTPGLGVTLNNHIAEKYRVS